MLEEMRLTEVDGEAVGARKSTRRKTEMNGGGFT